MKTLKIGFIGTGMIAVEKHMKNLAKIDGVELFGFMNRTKEKAVKAKEKYGSKDSVVFDTASDLIRDARIDVVHICTANDTHHVFAIEALKHDKHVMVEKPMAVSLDAAHAMYEASKTSKGKLSVAYQNRYRGEVTALKDTINKGILGELYYIKANALRRAGIPTWGTFTDKDVQGGGPLIDIGSHSLDLAFYAMDDFDVDSVFASVYSKLKDTPHSGNVFGKWDPSIYDVEDSVFAHIKMVSGATITLECSYALHTLFAKEADIVVSGTKGGADFVDGLRVNRVKNDQFVTETVDFEASDPSYIEMRQWIDAIKENTEPCVTAYQGFMINAVIAAIYESAQANTCIKMKTFLNKMTRK